MSSWRWAAASSCLSFYSGPGEALAAETPGHPHELKYFILVAGVEEAAQQKQPSSPPRARTPGSQR